jgi:membrane fusion protein (multidrug efflux system)
MFANAQVVQGVIPNAYLIPQAAVTRTPTGQATVFIANDKNVVETRNIQTAGVQGQNWIVTEGLKVGDKVIVEGVAKVKEGQQVNASPYTPQAQPAAQSSQTATPSAESKSSEAQQAKQPATSNT